MAIVSIPSVLKSYTDRQRQVVLPGTTVAEVVKELTSAYPDLAPHILDEDGTLRDYVNVFVNDSDIRQLDGELTAVEEDSTVRLLPAIAGGAPDSGEGSRR
ncbi:ubiquitin-like small modifier protein 1 [Acidipropionibacterium jensenii]|uniref:9.5 kDa culture filtrate antigen cfp10A n=1 Tax=Acidipropionibacterium jensenii TaxID=1749 RepID=A0A3S4UVX8_9ACTN|nr:ubiquitin-like small modifier protein 1 [Acidipropionibacterium jensenii]MDN5976272.1 MoaD/ThiS family protein [Acidipropionibacterium jensenii]MDN5995339.1 MoaD/ThiS family protein [Acidipropionibacterium jensenii]MDN6426596.1 MoaD/ThiS family protein [Acidipropionibacterium jensenii]MDN6440713.1 MoaD/ThiS family protein [Acidipropionibacterium jensenii]MDN6479619.1 MoaD/ThiS family protein [Acidipropionibacterium jensenii]